METKENKEKDNNYTCKNELNGLIVNTNKFEDLLNLPYKNVFVHNDYQSFIWIVDLKGNLAPKQVKVIKNRKKRLDNKNSLRKIKIMPWLQYFFLLMLFL